MSSKFRVPDFIRRRPTEKEQARPLRASDAVLAGRPAKVKKKFQKHAKEASQMTTSVTKVPASMPQQPSVRDILLRTTGPTTIPTSMAQEKREPKKRIGDTDQYVDALKLQLQK